MPDGESPLAASYLYQKDRRHIAQVPLGVEADAAREVSALGGTSVATVPRGVLFQAEPEAVYRIVYTARLLNRVLAPLVTFPCPDADRLYRNARAVNWPKLFHPDRRFSVHAHVLRNPIRNAHFAALRVKDAIVDRFRADTGRRPSVDIREPDLGLHLRIQGQTATISIDVSGGSLHRRGYRIRSVAAPMQETLAAAVVRRSGWDGETPLYDPMCGSGTLLVEACMHYCRIPAGMLRRRFGFEQLPDFDAETWLRFRRVADAGIRTLPDGLVAGSDVSAEAVAAARINAGRFPVLRSLRLKVADFRRLKGLERHTILCNPPYGIRLGRDQDMEGFYRELGDFLRERCGGGTAYLFLGEPGLSPATGLAEAWRQPMEAGGLSACLVRYDIPNGST